MLADATADAGPLWLKICIALVPPALAAIITGYFALSNTVNRRAERIKNLNDIRVSSSPELINPDYALERIILRELEALDRVTWQVLKGGKRSLIAGVLTVTATYAILTLNYILHFMSDTAGLITGLVLGGPSGILLYYWWFIRRDFKPEIRERYELAERNLEKLASESSSQLPGRNGKS